MSSFNLTCVPEWADNHRTPTYKGCASSQRPASGWQSVSVVRQLLTKAMRCTQFVLEDEMNREKNDLFKSSPDQSGSGSDQGGQQGQSQSSAPSLDPLPDKYRRGKASIGQQGPATLPPFNANAGIGDGDIPKNPGVRLKP